MPKTGTDLEENLKRLPTNNTPLPLGLEIINLPQTKHGITSKICYAKKSKYRFCFAYTFNQPKPKTKYQKKNQKSEKADDDYSKIRSSANRKCKFPIKSKLRQDDRSNYPASP